MIAALQVAVVLFSSGFWDSPFCTGELEQIVKWAEDQRIVYLPVYLFSTVADVRTAAHDWRGKAFAEKVRVCGKQASAESHTQ